MRRRHHGNRQFPNKPRRSRRFANRAGQDAQTAYGDLSEFKITLCRFPDGWHVDYDLTDPLAAGGGPHYVIDPESGDIVTRRYEQ